MIKKYKGMTIPDLIELLYKNNKKLDLIVSNDDYIEREEFIVEEVEDL